MRTNIDLDDDLLAEAMAASGLRTKKATVEEALRRLVRRHRQKTAIATTAGIGWVGDLDEMRRNRPDARCGSRICAIATPPRFASSERSTSRTSF